MSAGRESLLDEDYTSEQVEQELAPLALQLAYIASKGGNYNDALEQYEV